MEYRSRITEGGRIVLPAAVRKALHLNIGEEVVLKMEHGELRVITLPQAVEQAQAVVKQYNMQNVSLTESLKKLRQDDLKND